MPAVLIRYLATVPVPAVGGLRVRCDSGICDPGWRAVGRIEMEYRVLGPVEVLADGRPAAIGGPKPRSLLVLLLLNAGRVVPTSQVIESLWGGRPPLSGASVRLPARLMALPSWVMGLPPGNAGEACPVRTDVRRRPRGRPGRPDAHKGVVL
jgi:hypothetical protein